MPKTLMMSGFDLRVAELPDNARIILPPPALPGVDDFRDLANRALEAPVSGPPFSELLRPDMRVAVVIDDLSLPVPPPARDCRREMLEVVLRHLSAAGVRPPRITVLVANGLSRQWRGSELAEVLGPQATTLPIVCHDAEEHARLARIGELAEGPVELNRVLTEADLVVHLNVVSLPILAGLAGLMSGTSGYRTARFLMAPALFNTDQSLLMPGSPSHRLQERVGELLTRRTKVFQLATVLSNDLWTPALGALLKSETGLSRPLQVWNALPAAVRHRAARLLKSSYRPLLALAGPPAAVAPLALEAFHRQHTVNVPDARPAQVLLFGLPDQGPGSVRSAQNPVLTANLALGYVANLFTRQSLLQSGGVIIFSNPLQPVFDRKMHLPHEEFYERVLRLERDPAAIHERFEPFFAGRPEYVANYQQRFSFHGAHPLYAWYQCAPARQRAGRIIVANADPRACARLGFTPANDVTDALNKAREFLGVAQPEISVLELPPPYWVNLG